MKAEHQMQHLPGLPNQSCIFFFMPLVSNMLTCIGNSSKEWNFLSFSAPFLWDAADMQSEERWQTKTVSSLVASEKPPVSQRLTVVKSPFFYGIWSSCWDTNLGTTHKHHWALCGCTQLSTILDIDDERTRHQPSAKMIQKYNKQKSYCVFWELERPMVIDDPTAVLEFSEFSADEKELSSDS